MQIEGGSEESKTTLYLGRSQRSLTGANEGPKPSISTERLQLCSVNASKNGGQAAIASKQRSQTFPDARSLLKDVTKSLKGGGAASANISAPEDGSPSRRRTSAGEKVSSDAVDFVAASANDDEGSQKKGLKSVKSDDEVFKTTDENETEEERKKGYANGKEENNGEIKLQWTDIISLKTRLKLKLLFVYK